MTFNIAADLNTKARNLAAEAEALRARLRVVDSDLRDIAAAARLYDVELETPIAANLRNSLTVRDIVLRKLTEAGTEGVTVAKLRGECGDLHEKTIGMTLYRLKLDGICKRVGGRLWVIA